MTSAAQRTLGIPELLEMILVELHHPLDILRTRQVCRLWRDLVNESMMLQQECFLLPEKPSRTGSQNWRLNPVLEKLGFDIGEEPSAILMPTKRDDNLKTTGSNRQFARLRRDLKPFPAGSWPEMLATQPPTPIMLMDAFNPAPFPGQSLRPVVIYANEPERGGLLLGDVSVAFGQDLRFCKSHRDLGPDMTLLNFYCIPWPLRIYVATESEVRDLRYGPLDLQDRIPPEDTTESPTDPPSVTVIKGAPGSMRTKDIYWIYRRWARDDSTGKRNLSYSCQAIDWADSQLD